MGRREKRFDCEPWALEHLEVRKTKEDPSNENNLNLRTGIFECGL